MVTSYIVGIAGFLTPVLAPCTIDLTSRGLPEHPPNGVEKGQAGPSPDGEAGPSNHEAAGLRSWTGFVTALRRGESSSGWKGAEQLAPGGWPASPARTAAQPAHALPGRCAGPLAG